MIDEILERALAGGTLTDDDLTALLETHDRGALATLYAAAYQMKLRHVGNQVHLRGLIEISNLCTKNCFYCGIRRDNSHVKRFAMSKAEILAAARLAEEFRYGSVVLQGGERNDPGMVDFIEDVLHEIKEIDGGALGGGEVYVVDAGVQRRFHHPDRVLPRLVQGAGAQADDTDRFAAMRQFPVKQAIPSLAAIVTDVDKARVGRARARCRARLPLDPRAYPTLVC